MDTDSAPSPSHPSRKRDTSGTHRRIINAALEEFTAHGYAATSTRSIAEKAGVSEPTLFRHFGNKKRLFLAVLEEFSMLDRMHHILTDHLTGNVRYDLSQIGWFYMRTIIERRKGFLMILNEAEHIPEARSVSAHLYRQIGRALAVYLRQQIKLGKLRDQGVDWMAQAFLGMLFAYGIRSNLLSGHLGPSLSPEDAVNRFVNYFLDGVIVKEEGS